MKWRKILSEILHWLINKWLIELYLKYRKCFEVLPNPWKGGRIKPWILSQKVVQRIFRSFKKIGKIIKQSLVNQNMLRSQNPFINKNKTSRTSLSNPSNSLLNQLIKIKLFLSVPIKTWPRKLAKVKVVNLKEPIEVSVQSLVKI